MINLMKLILPFSRLFYAIIERGIDYGKNI